jgi:2,3-bisphosphoglycerate-independent phosphoglycerate mutase
MMPDRPFLLLAVLDGFGCRAERDWNAIAQARTPTFDRLFRDFSWTTLEASGLRVGLPDGQMGNSEVGHLNIGAGRVVDQDIVRISKAVDRQELAENRVLVDAFTRLKRNRNAIHFAGLLSDGGVHSLQHHLHGLIDAAVAHGLHREEMPSIYLHAILDGRDTPPRSALGYLKTLQQFIADKPDVRLASIIGRYYAMDRDRRWERTKRAHDLMTLGIGTESKDPLALIERFYAEGITDEFMEPIAVLDSSGAHRGKLTDGATLLLFNFRADRMRQLITVFSDPEFDGFERTIFPRIDLVSMVRYHEDYDFPVVFPPEKISGHLGEVLSGAGLTQLRIAETEKYAHVTYFLNGGSDTPSRGEERILVPSSKVATYDRQPEMSVQEIARRLIAEIDARHFDVAIMNIANPDMVGHTGVMEATVEAIEETDAALQQILDATERAGGVALITADHGNAEVMFDPATGQAHTAHTSNPVPLILFDPLGLYGRLQDGGALENVAPTMLEILGVETSPEMTAGSLLERTR